MGNLYVGRIGKQIHPIWGYWQKHTPFEPCVIICIGVSQCVLNGGQVVFTVKHTEECKQNTHQGGVSKNNILTFLFPPTPPPPQYIMNSCPS